MLISPAALKESRQRELRKHLLPLATTFDELESWLVHAFANMARGEHQTIHLRGVFNADDEDDDLIRQIQERISFGGVPRGYWAMLCGANEINQIRVELYRER